MCCHGKKLATAYLHNWQPQEWVNLKTMDEVIGQLFLINYSLGTNSTVKSFKQLGVAKSVIYKVLQNLENRGATEKQLSSRRTAVKLTKGKRKQLVNAAMDNDQVRLTKIAKKLGVHKIYVRRVFKWEGLKYYKRKFTKADFWEGCRPRHVAKGVWRVRTNPLFLGPKKKKGWWCPRLAAACSGCDRAMHAPPYVGLRFGTESWKCCSVDLRQTIGIPSNVHYQHPLWFSAWIGKAPMNHLFCSWGCRFGWVDKAQYLPIGQVPLVRARTFQGFSRHLASSRLSRNTLLICLNLPNSSKSFHTTVPPHIVPMYRISKVSALKTVSGNAACRRSGISVMSRRYLDIRNFFGNWRKSLNFGVFATLNLKIFWGAPPDPPQNVTPFSNTLATCLRPDSRSLVGSSWSGCQQSHQPLSGL